MSDDSIQSETLIHASIERVWSLVSQPGFWVAEAASLLGTVAREGETVMAKNPDYGEFPVLAVTVRPPTYLAYRWASTFPGEALRADNSTLVEFTLVAEGDATRLRVVESGFGALTLSAAARGKAMTDNTGGWALELAALKARAA